MSRTPWQSIGSRAEQLVAQLTNAAQAVLDDPTDNENQNRLVQIVEEGHVYCAEVDQAVARMHARDMGR